LGAVINSVDASKRNFCNINWDNGRFLLIGWDKWRLARAQGVDYDAEQRKALEPPYLYYGGTTGVLSPIQLSLWGHRP
ncbi:hypothetical protein ACQ5T6_14355, partial [Vibrio cholerae]|uniref:hypothetical protein n=1 Tax=Vibrio cholerae TaxID=666 RepID=UPI003D345300